MVILLWGIETVAYGRRLPMRYYWKSVGPVLILEDQDGGMYCFYYGFDQYISERAYIENMMLFPASQYAEKEYEDVLKNVACGME